jgi:predicted secreted protein
MESLVSVLVYVFYSSGSSFHNLRTTSMKSTGPIFYLFASVTTSMALLAYLLLAFCAKRRWVKANFSQCNRRLLSIATTSILTAIWLVAFIVIVPVAVCACADDSSFTSNDEHAKLQLLIVKYSSLSATVISAIIVILFVISLVLLIVTATEKELFDIDSCGSEDIILGWLDATAHYPVKTGDDKMKADARRESQGGDESV